MPRVMLAGLLLLVAQGSEAQPTARQVLVLQSFDRGVQVLDYLTGNLRVDLDERIGKPVNVVQVVVTPFGAIGAPEQAVVDYLRAKYAGGPGPDLIVTFAGPATVFARKHRRELFPDAPLLIAAVDRRYLRGAALGENETAIAVDNDIPQLVDEIQRLLPDTKHVFIVLGAGQLNTLWYRELEKDFERFRDRLTFIWSRELSLAEIVRRCATLPSHSAILHVSFGTDAEGGMYPDERVLAELRATANAPLFGVNSVLVGSGIVGGTLMDNEQNRRNVADAAIRLLHGTPPSSITVPMQRPGPPIFDWRELQRWGIPEGRLPAGSIVRHREPSLWRAYRGTVLSAAGLLAVQSLLIAGLLYQRRARRRAESDSRRNLALAADAGRRETMSALTSSIGHELGQPLGSIVSNAQALQMMVTANRATSETIGEILSDIQTQGVRATEIIDRHRTMLRSRQLDKTAIDVHGIINETLGLLEHTLSMRQVEARTDLASGPSVVDGDPVLLQQVLVNLVVNAVDAMVETPPARRRVTISSEVQGEEVHVSVRDTGPGLPAHMIGTPFKPFVTTKAHGLGIGLTIVRSIVDAHDGIIAGRNHPQGGAIFTMTLRRSASASVAGALH